MAPKRFFFILFQAKQLNPDLVIRIFGDHDQCTPMKNDWIDYMDSQLFRSLVDHNRMTLPYQEGSCRYDKPLSVSLVHLLDTGTLHEAFDDCQLRDDTVMSMSLSNTGTRARINQQEAAKWSGTQEFTVGDKQYSAGMPIVSVVNLKSQGILNGDPFVFVTADNKTVTLSEKKKTFELSHTDFTKEGNFRLGFCDSVFRTQGYTRREPYNVYDVPLMCIQDIYTALSRFTTMDDIGFDASQLKGHVFERKRPSEKQVRIKLEKPELIDALIYRISDGDGNQYIGYTTGKMESRYHEHKTDPDEPPAMKTWLATTKTNIELVCNVRCLDLTEVRAIEASLIGRVPRELSKNTQHKQKETATLNLADRCNVITTPQLDVDKVVKPSVKNDTKNRRWKVQQRGFKPKYFSYGPRKQETSAESEQLARAWRFTHT
jgi:hypothetical protein